MKAVSVRREGKSNFMLESCGLENNFISSWPHIRFETRCTVGVVVCVRGEVGGGGCFVVTVS
jgi:hypothetical protein